MPPGFRTKVVIANPASGGVFLWLVRLYAFTFAVLGVLLLIAGLLLYRHFANQTPPAPDLARYAAEVPGVSRVYAGDGTLLAEFATERRELVAYEDIPQALIEAFLAAEDHLFFEHQGIYFRAIARALWANLIAGDFAQGGSTITQQVAKQFLSSEKSLTRKAKEAILARRMEAKFDKQVILSLYLNHIYLGNGTYGVKAAARGYFSKDLDELEIGEMALIAGLAQAPSRYSPTRNPARTRTRRNHILKRMAERGFISAEQAAHWQQQPIVLNLPEDIFPNRMPYFAEYVRRYVVNRHGLDTLMKRGLHIETTGQPVVDGAAAENVDFGARKQDKRQGWRGPEAYLEGRARETFLTRASALYGNGPLQPNRRYLGLVESVRRSGATVRVGPHAYPLPLENMQWAAAWSRVDAVNDNQITSARSALKAGDVVWVRKKETSRGRFRDWFLSDGANPRWLRRSPPRRDQARRSPPRRNQARRNPPRRNQARREQAQTRLMLDQVPHPQSAIFTADHRTGYVLAMIGGNDFSRSQYNRVVQACRQPGSTYKPIYYSAALDAGYGFDTVLNDIPRAEVDPVTGEVWTPTNLGGTVDDQVSLEYALVFSKNIPSVAIFKKIGAHSVAAWARRLGFTTKIIPDQALALGASCTYLDELTRAFAIFARNGRWVDWTYVRRIIDRQGNILEDNTTFFDPMLAAGDRLDRLYATAGTTAKQVIPARTAYLTSKLLRHAIQYGFAWILRQTGVKAAGKTGTSSATMDTSFVGYTSRWITGVWLGDDMRVRPLGRDDAAYMTVVPMWARYMYETSNAQPTAEIPWDRPAGQRRKDRGDHSKGEHGEPMPLVYRKAAKSDDPLLLQEPTL